MLFCLLLHFSSIGLGFPLIPGIIFEIIHPYQANFFLHFSSFLQKKNKRGFWIKDSELHIHFQWTTNFTFCIHILEPPVHFFFFWISTNISGYQCIYLYTNYISPFFCLSKTESSQNSLGWGDNRIPSVIHSWSQKSGCATSKTSQQGGMGEEGKTQLVCGVGGWKELKSD